jgi:multidrug resistance protein, MATE family
MNFLKESRLTLRLAVPLIIGQLSQMLLGVADTIMVGRLGVADLAALNFASALFHVPFVFGIGLLTAVSVFSANAHGRNEPAAARASCRHGLYLATVLGLLLFALGWGLSSRLDLFGQPPDVAGRTITYFQIVMASVIPALMSIALKNHADALGRPWPPFWIFLGGVLLNIALNWVLIYGNLGSPALGFEGAAWATLIARSLMVAAMIVWLTRAKNLREWVPFRWLRAPDMVEIRRLLTIGWPASLQMLSEVGAFSAAGLIMGRFGPVSMAAHQIAITCAATAFMIPLGLSMALTVRIGQADGAEELARLRPIAVTGWLLAAFFALATALIFWFLGEWIAGWFVDAPEVVQLTASLMVIVAVFQLVDSLQVASVSMLRGLHDARMPALIGFSSYWLVGLPVAAWFAFGMNLEAEGVWWGLAAGLTVACFTLVPRLWRRTAPGRPA